MIRIVNDEVCIVLSDCVFNLNRFRALEKVVTDNKKEATRILLDVGDNGIWLNSSDSFSKVTADVYEGYEALEEITEKRNKEYKNQARALR